ncbi:class I SAM-dependent methyltransferase [Parapusillimonas sp. SGNA-6]|nr:class I SAM-dependent methyltransferase [Parapusillimonas sp. SGNA-6]
MSMRNCWCGNTNLHSFGPDYSVCSECDTVVYPVDMGPEQFLVRDDDTDYYGKTYWLEHQQEDLGSSDIYARARSDLAERNLHWLRALLKYQLPPAKVMELGCSHGSFLALLTQAGFDALGVEMSPWVVHYAKETFGASVLTGPIETLDIGVGSQDVIVLMDVLEHLPDPAGTMRQCLRLLKPEGFLLIQTPQYKEGAGYDSMREANIPFLDMLIPKEHIYLFSQRSVTRLFRELGADYVCFEQPIFGQYDMFFTVSRVPLPTYTVAQAEEVLLSRPSGRIALAMLDLREREIDLFSKWAESETDRAARWEQIQALTAMLKESEADRAARLEIMNRLTEMLRKKSTFRQRALLRRAKLNRPHK